MKHKSNMKQCCKNITLVKQYQILHVQNDIKNVVCAKYYTFSHLLHLFDDQNDLKAIYV